MKLVRKSASGIATTSYSISRPQRNPSAVTLSPCHSADVAAIAEVAAEALEAATEAGEVVSAVDVEVSRLARRTQYLVRGIS